MSYKIYLFLLSFFEASAIGTLFLHYDENYKLFLFYIIHIPTSILFAFIIWRLMPFRYRYPMRPTYSLIATFIIFTSIFGLAALSLLFIIVYRFKIQPVRIDIREINIPAMTASPRVTMHKFGVGGALKRVKNETILQEKRIEALLAISQANTPTTNQILKQALHDKTDEIRLLAFSLLDKQENSISKTIAANLEKEKKQISKVKLANIFKNLGLLYWEYVYRNILETELISKALITAQAYLEQAVKDLPDDPYIYIALGKIYMRKKQYDKAKQAYHKANELGISNSRVTPYLAELEYYEKNYVAIKSILNKASNLDIIPKIGHIVEFWNYDAKK